VAATVVAALCVVVLGVGSWRSQSELRERLEMQQARLRELGLDSALHHHSGESERQQQQQRRLPPEPPPHSHSTSRRSAVPGHPAEESRDVMDATWSARIEITRWDRISSALANASGGCAAPFSRSASGSLLLDRLDACTFVESPGSFSWDDLERFDLCCLGEHQRLLCGIPSEVAPLSGERASLALYEGAASLELARRPRRCTLYVVVSEG
jgi:hypothetical protein